MMAKYSKGAQKSVESAMKRMEKGKLKSGKSNKKVTNPKQAIAIGLSEAREKGAKVAKKASSKKTVLKKAAPAKATVKPNSIKKVAKKASPKKAAKKSAINTKSVIVKRPTVKKQAKPKEELSEKDLSEELIPASNEAVLNPPPVEERSPSVLTDKTQDPIWVADKKTMIKQTAIKDLHHNFQLSGSKSAMKPSGKKPLGRK